MTATTGNPGKPASTSPSPDKRTSPTPQPATASVHDDVHAFWTEQWYPVAFAQDVPLGKLFPFRLFDRPYLLFKDQATSLYVVIDDVCPHRAVPLSEGRLLNDNGKTVLECAYHGWQFDCSGTCTSIPGGGDDFKIPASANISGIYATTVNRANLIFFFPGDRLRADAVPIVQPSLIDEPGAIIFRDMRREVPLPYELLVENILDPAHVNFAHHGTPEGNRKNFSPAGSKSLRIVRSDDALGELEAVSLRSGGREVTTIMRGGGTSSTTIATSPFLDFQLILYNVPTSRNTSTVFAYRVLVKKPSPEDKKLNWRSFLPRLPKLPTPRWVEHCIGHVILDGDTTFLLNTEVQLRAAGKTWRDAYVLANGPYDCTTAVFRTWFDRHGHTMPFLLSVEDMPLTIMTTEEANDRVRWHGKDCESCTGALRNFRAGRFAAAVIAVVAMATAVTAWSVAGALSANGQLAVGRKVAWGAWKAIAVALIAAGVAIGCNKGVTALTYTDSAKTLLSKE